MSASLACGEWSLTTQAPRPSLTPVSCEILYAENLGDELKIYWRDGYVSHFLALWLRERLAACLANPDDTRGERPDCASVLSNQSALSRQLAEPDHIQVDNVRVLPDGFLELKFEPEGEIARFDPSWLRRFSYDEWNQKGLTRYGWRDDFAVPSARIDEILATPSNLCHWLQAVQQFGVARITDLPGDQGLAGHIIKHLGLSETSVASAGQLHFSDMLTRIDAATGERPAATAEAYRDPVPSLRVLHCCNAFSQPAALKIVDGFAAAQALRKDCPVFFGLLQSFDIPFAYRDKEASLVARHRSIEVDGRGAITRICYSPRRVAPLDLSPEVMRDYYRAYYRFQSIIEQAELAKTFAFETGDLWIIDNRRIPHTILGRASLEAVNLEAGFLDGRIRALEETLTPLTSREPSLHSTGS